MFLFFPTTRLSHLCVCLVLLIFRSWLAKPCPSGYLFLPIVRLFLSLMLTASGLSIAFLSAKTLRISICPLQKLKTLLKDVRTQSRGRLLNRMQQAKTAKQLAKERKKEKARQAKAAQKQSSKSLNVQLGSRVQGASSGSVPNPRTLVPNLPLIKESPTFSKDVLRFMNMQVDPFNSDPTRLPDGCADKTMMATSVDIWEIPVYFPNVSTPDDGKFAFLVQPTYGGLDVVDDYATAIVKASGGWPADLTIPSAYMDGNDSGNGIDPRISKYYQELTQNSLALSVIIGGGFGGNTYPLGNAPVVSGTGYGLPVKFTTSGVTANELSLPPGQYAISYVATKAAGGLVAPTVAVVGNANVLVQQNDLSPDGKLVAVNVLFSNLDHGLFAIGSTVSPDSSNMNISTIFTPALPIVSNFGVTSQVRPLACSVLVTSMVPPLLEGGMIGCAALPGAVSESEYFTNNPIQSIGQLQSWENLGVLPNGYSGKWKDGCYAWWTYEDEDDWQFYSPTKMLQNAYPTLAFAGQLVPQAVTGTPPTSIAAVRVVVTRVFEVLTLVRLFDIESCLGSTAEFTTAMELLALQPRCMMNEEHRSFIARLMAKARSAVGTARKIFENNKSWLIPLGTTIAGLL